MNRYLFFTYILILTCSTFLSGQAYFETMACTPSSSIKDVLHMDDKTYYIKSDLKSYSIFEINRAGAQTFLHQGQLGTEFAKFFQTGASSWDLVATDMIEDDLPRDDIHLISKDSSDEINVKVFKHDDPGAQVPISYVHSIERRFQSYYVVGSAYARLNHDEGTYSPVSTFLSGFVSRDHVVSQGYSWDGFDLFEGMGGRILKIFDQEIVDVDCDPHSNFVLFADKIIELDTLTNEVKDTIFLNASIGQAKEIKIDANYIYVIQDGARDRITRILKENPTIQGYLYLEPNPDINIKKLSLSNGKLVTVSELCSSGCVDLIHLQEPRLLAELKDRNRLAIQMMDNDLHITPNQTLQGSVIFSLTNMGENFIGASCIYSNLYTTTTSFTDRFIEGLDLDLNPGESKEITLDLDLDYYPLDSISFHMIAADRMPLNRNINLDVNFSIKNPGVEENQHLKFYPNPISKNHPLYYELPSGVTHLEIYDNVGKWIQNKTISSNGSLRLDLNSGIYLINAFDGKTHYWEKLVIN